MASPWPPRPAILCLVSDRLALARAVAPLVDPLQALERQVAAAVDAGVDLVHIRERDLESGRLRDLAGACAARAAGTATRIVVNDRLDVALVSGAHGVHLRGDSYSAADARRLAPAGFLIGCSVRNAAAAAAAADADYLVLGTVFPTPSKPDGPTVVGTGELARAASVSPVPVLAIGGMAEDRLGEVARTGAAGIAAIRLFFGLGSEGSTDAWRRRLSAWREMFDTNRPIS
jgi:thiamine-phosphate diphosphorylase